ncbi:MULTISPECIES: acyl-CoA dehydrogenase family protein [Oceanobacillus]|uniref:Acyl-CoA dehydrogenase family protein n=1 Tax=Oceanobacillus aidingensis TaxID=645964 RepID=A0ABV9K081_9BACI|nr:acyl-CoA dehydrogenase family protein [Oceanobacillus oncorhynchi]MDM8098633.1 acyl-CoA dehydrogenase family protein [Oceanobacillus oncorhynchi]
MIDAQQTDKPIQLNETERQELRESVRELCESFGNAYWRKLDVPHEYPHEFVDALTKEGYLSVLIPQEYGGKGYGIAEATIILEEIHRAGGHAAACHAQMYTMGALLRHGSPDQKERYLPGIAKGELRLQAFSITEPEAGSNTTGIKTFAEKTEDGYVITGHKNWTSRVLQSDLILVLARTTPLGQVDKKSNGISLFLVDLREVRENQPDSFVVEPVRTMFNYATNKVWYKEMKVPHDCIIGEEGKGFKYVLDGMNAERILLAAETIGDGYFFIDKAVDYANEREVFDRKIGQNQGVQFPIARAYASIKAADLLRYEAAEKFDSGEVCGEEANMAKLLSSEASWEAANVCINTFGGNGFVDEYDVERKFRETRMYQVAPVNNNLILAYLGQHVLGMPRSY